MNYYGRPFFFFYLHLWNWLGFRSIPPHVKLICLFVKIGHFATFSGKGLSFNHPNFRCENVGFGEGKVSISRFSILRRMSPWPPDPPGFHFEHNVGVVWRCGDVDNLRNDRKPYDLCDIPGGVGFLSSSAVIWIGRWQDDSKYEIWYQRLMRCEMLSFGRTTAKRMGQIENFCQLNIFI